MTIVRECDSKMITQDILVVARVEARAETFSTDNSCTYKKRWIGINPVEVVHELDPVAGQELLALLHGDTESGGRPKLLKV